MNLMLTTEDHSRLQELMFFAKCPRSTLEVMTFQHLTQVLECAIVVPPEHIPPGVVTINSLILARDLDFNNRIRTILCWPEDENERHDLVSVLTPLGIALIGKREGDSADWTMQTGRRRLCIETVSYQSESEAEAMHPSALAQYAPL